MIISMLKTRFSMPPMHLHMRDTNRKNRFFHEKSKNFDDFADRKVTKKSALFF